MLFSGKVSSPIIRKALAAFLNEFHSFPVDPQKYYRKSEIINRLINIGIDKETARLIVCLTPPILMGIEIGEILYFGDDDRLRIRENGNNSTIVSVIKSMTKDIEEFSPDLKFLLPNGNGYFVKVVDIWIGDKYIK